MNAVGPIWSNRCFRLGVTSLFWLSTAYFIPPFFSTRAPGAPGRARYAWLLRQTATRRSLTVRGAEAGDQGGVPRDLDTSSQS